MKSTGKLAMLAAGLTSAMALAQPAGTGVPAGREPGKGQGPPPQAYEDCKGRKAGDTVLHATPEGKVSATCVDSPNGLVARPAQPPRSGSRPGGDAPR